MVKVPPDIDVLVVVAPQQMTDTQRYAIDQFLMRGGAIIVAGSNFRVNVDPMTGLLTLAPITDGIQEMLGHYGVTVDLSLVLDPQNEPFPIAVSRDVGWLCRTRITSHRLSLLCRCACGWYDLWQSHDRQPASRHAQLGLAHSCRRSGQQRARSHDTTPVHCRKLDKR